MGGMGMGGMGGNTTFKMSGNMGNVDPNEIFKMFFGGSGMGGGLGGFTKMSSNGGNRGSANFSSAMDE